MTLITAAVIAYAGWRAHGGRHERRRRSWPSWCALAAASQSLRQLANLQTVMAEGWTAARRLFAALDVEPEVARRSPAPSRCPAPQATMRLRGRRLRL